MVSSTRFLSKLLIINALYFFVTTFTSIDVRAHGGHDHGKEKTTKIVQQENPKLSAESELFQLVGVNNGGILEIHLDEYITNAPIENAIIEITLDTETYVAKEISAALYAVEGEWLRQAGKHNLVISVTAGERIDLLLADLIVPDPTKNLKEETGQWWATYLKPAVSIPLVISLAVGVLLGLFFRNAVFPATTLAVLFLAFWPAGTASAHEGHDHGVEKSGEKFSDGSQPTRFPDGSIYLPKPSQRLLKIRTIIAKNTQQARKRALLGQIIADPTNKAVVQAVRNGRVEFSPSGPPVIGQRVTKGETIATLIPILSPEALAGLSEQIGSLNQEIALTAQRLDNLGKLAKVTVKSGGKSSLSAVSKNQITELVIKMEQLKKRREKINAISFGPIDLVASRSGIIISVDTRTGQVVSAGDTLVEIIDPRRVWVEAIVYPGQTFDEKASSRVVLQDRSSMPLSFISRSASLKAQTLTAFFRVENEKAIPLGTPVKVMLESKQKQKSILLPLDAIVRGSSGLSIVWIQMTPEQFRPQIVQAETFDRLNATILSGVKSGDRVVTRGASLLNQVR